LLAQGYVFEEGEEILEQFLGIEMSAKQIQRVSEHYGQAMEEHIEQQVKDKVPVAVLPMKTQEEVVYGMIDGSMIFTREKGWKEIKLGRLFTASSCVGVQPGRNEVMQSLYVCHLGGHKKFLQKFEAHTEPYAHKVFIADGAKWIWNWVEDCYEGSVQILDFYHAMEKLGVYASHQYKDEKERRGWMEKQKEVLLSGGVERLIADLKSCSAVNKEAGTAKASVVRYYERNISRMQYHTFVEKGYMIGSGAIEAAHRSVIQQRLKLSGQRWNIKGAQKIANLRACKKSKQWNRLIQLIKSAA
jgi:hypothetical protein